MKLKNATQKWAGCSAFLLLLITAAIPAAAQLGQAQSQQDSPRWWTLTSDISPSQLEAIHQDTLQHQQRYREAVPLAQRASLPTEQVSQVDFFVDGQTHPELFQMWSVVDALAIAQQDGSINLGQGLAKIGVAGSTIKDVEAFFAEYSTERAIRMAEQEKAMGPVLNFADRARGQMGEEAFSQAVTNGDVAALAQAAGVRLRQAEQLMTIWNRVPHEDLGVQMLPLLKDLLPGTAWEQFRYYLLTQCAPHMKTTSTAILVGGE